MGTLDGTKRRRNVIFYSRDAKFLFLGLFTISLGFPVFLLSLDDGPNNHRNMQRAHENHDLKQTAQSEINASSLLGVVPRTFQPWKHGEAALCEAGFDDVQKMASARDDPIDHGLLFLKPVKTASSTTSGINLRMARNIARRLGKNFTFCDARFSHGLATDQFAKRNPKKSFLWTVIRDPTERAISQFFHFAVSREKVEPTDRNFRKYLLEKSRDYYLAVLSLLSFQQTRQKYNLKTTKEALLPMAQSIIDDYDFIGVTERMDESLVALQMLLDLPTDDLLFLKAKASGGYDDGAWTNGCVYIVPKFLSPGIKKLLASDAWQDTIHHDLAVYRAADRSLDLTIEKLGREKFNAKLLAFRKAQQLVSDKCQATAVLPCLPSGEKARKVDGLDCLWEDSGCGATCLDSVAATL